MDKATRQAVLVEGDAATAFALLEKVIATGGHDWQEICRKVDECHCQIWLAVTDRPIAALVSQATVDDELELLIAGGSGARLWAGEAERFLTEFAKEHGLHTLRIFGRSGWVYYFPHWEIKGKEDGLLILERNVICRG